MAVLRSYFWHVMPVTCALLLPAETAFLAAYGGNEAAVVVMAVNKSNERDAGRDENEKIGDAVTAFTGHLNDRTPTSLHVCGGELVMPSEDGTVKAWNFVTQEPTWSVSVGQPGIVKMAISRDGEWLAAGSARERKITLWRRGTET
jgi:WD40 repeat protein